MSESILDPRSNEDGAFPASAGAEESGGVEGPAAEQAVAYALVDCCFAVGQAIGMRTTVDYEAIVWWHDHFRAKFLAAIRHHGDRWSLDRERVTAVGWLLAERALKHAAGRSSVDVEAARLAAADVERFCAIHAKRAQEPGGDDAPDPRLAGYWCLRFPR